MILVLQRLTHACSPYRSPISKGILSILHFALLYYTWRLYCHTTHMNIYIYKQASAIVQSQQQLVMHNQDSDEIEVNQYMSKCPKPIPLKVITKLKFKNQIFSEGDDIALLQGRRNEKNVGGGKRVGTRAGNKTGEEVIKSITETEMEVPLTTLTRPHCYGKILLIGKVPITKFPVLLIAWYYSRGDAMVEQLGVGWLGRKQLLLSQWTDWQYVESLHSKIKVMDINKWQTMDIYQREEPNTFYCRAMIKGIAGDIQGDHIDAHITPAPPAICHCLSPFNPDHLTVACSNCGVLFHPTCTQNEELCLLCQ